jgi:hypothetical protein
MVDLAAERDQEPGATGLLVFEELLVDDRLLDRISNGEATAGGDGLERSDSLRRQFKELTLYFDCHLHSAHGRPRQPGATGFSSSGPNESSSAWTDKGLLDSTGAYALSVTEPSLDQQQQLEAILTESSWFVAVLETVRTLELPHWVVGAGVIRNLVWDALEGRTPGEVRDVDVAFFDSADLSRERDREVERELRAQMPEVPWEVTNQAGVHLWYAAHYGQQIPPALSIEDAVGMWPETATAVAVTLDDGGLRVIAPVGLDDLLGLVLRRNPRQVTREYFARRVREKRVSERWPHVRVVYD